MHRNFPMNVIYSDEVRNEGELQRATKVLEEVIGRSFEKYTAEWDKTADGNGRSNFRLRLSDRTGEIRAEFAPAEFQNQSHLRRRLIRLWGDLLEIRSHKLLDDLMGDAEE